LILKNRTIFGFITALVVAGTAICPLMVEAREPEPGYVGSDTCEICHDTVMASLRKSPHWTAFLKEMPDEDARGCESCHGPGERHAEDPTEPIPVSFRDEPAADRVVRCIACHEGRNSIHFTRSIHYREGQACDDCHVSGHEEDRNPPRALLREEDPRLCFECHTDLEAVMTFPFRHRTSDGVLRCSDCHNVHRESVQRMSRWSREDSCIRCHSDNRGPFMFEHLASTVNGCSACHQPHGSTNPKLLVRADVRYLCLECHDDTTRYHDLSDPRFQNCTVCHTAIHGSHVDSKFLR